MTYSDPLTVNFETLIYPECATGNTDGSATLSGNISGTLDANTVGHTWQNGSSC